MKLIFLFLLLAGCTSTKLNKNPNQIEIVTSDIDNFWIAYESFELDSNPQYFQELYINQGSPGVKGFLKMRIQSADNLAKVVLSHPNYFSSLKQSTDSINVFKEHVRASFRKLKMVYDEAVFPPVYFVIGAMNSGGTTSSDGLIIGAEMYGLQPGTAKDELNPWLQEVIKPVNQLPHIVAHELIHYQQKYRANSLLEQSIKEGSADFIAELISGKHINQHVHEFGNPREEELWNEFSSRMQNDDYEGWLYSSTEGRPNDLGYWMGYKITEAYYENSEDTKEAIRNILQISNFQEFLSQSRYAEKFQ